MFRKKGEFLGVYNYADEVFAVYPNPIEGAIIAVVKPLPHMMMCVDGRWEQIVTVDETSADMTPNKDDNVVEGNGHIEKPNL